MNDQSLGLLSICQTEDTAKAPYTIKEWELWETVIVAILTIDQDAMLLFSHHNYKINYLLEYAMGHHPGWESYFTPLDEGELLSVHWDLLILLWGGPIKCTTHDIEHAPSKEERRRESSSVISYP